MPEAYLRVPSAGPLEDALAEAFQRASADQGVVFVAAEVSDQWSDVAAELGEAFELTRGATRAGRPVVFIVASADLLGQRGAGPAMVACGLLSGARTLAFENRKHGIPANVLATEPDSAPEDVARWARRLFEENGPSGELVRLGAGHVGKALP